MPIPRSLLLSCILAAGFATTLQSAEPPSRLANLSTRAHAGVGDDVIIGGFVIADAPKQVLIRAVGPGLAPFVSNVLGDPAITVFNQAGAAIATNDDWPAAAAPVFAQVGAFPLGAGSKDAALVLDLAPGIYTAHVGGVGGAQGVALLEIYDVTGGANASKLLNISARARIGVGESVMIPGLVIASGAGPRRVLVRAAGPALAALNVAGRIADPTLRLVSSTGATIAENNDWGSFNAPLIANTAATTGAFPFPDPDSRDAALIVDLPGGAYTVLVSGVGATTGIALVELYDVTPEGVGAVSIAANDGAANESGSDPAVFTISRTGPTGAPLMVAYFVGGTATNGIDYALLSGTAVIPAGETSTTVVVAPLPDVDNEPAEQVTLTLLPLSGYVIDAGFASATINSTPAALYLATLRPETGAIDSAAYGTATILLSASGTVATVNVSLANLSSAQTTAYLRLGPPGQTGAYLSGLPIGQVTGTPWMLDGGGVYSNADLLNALQTGQIYLGVETANYPTGELRGHFIQASGSQTFSPPADPPAAAGAPASANEAARFLTQATFGPTQTEIDALLQTTYAQWIDAQIAKTATLHRDATMADFAAFNAGGQAPDANGVNQRPGSVHRRAAWWKTAVTSEDQLRQRVAFALSELFVISEINGTLNSRQEGMANYYDLLVRGAFGNFRTLLEDVTLSPMMGIYLSHLRNARATSATGPQPDENYAREVMQLFTIGLVELQPDGTLKLNSSGLPVATYDQATITEMAKVFTGWSYHNTNTSNAGQFRGGPANYLEPMSLFLAFHDTSAKTIVRGIVIPANQSGEQDLDDALDALFNHPNTPPFIARRLIQRLVTSNPSPGYVYRVARVFENNGAGVRGDLGAVVRAILLDYEARAGGVAANAGYGKLKEPLLRATALLRAFQATDSNGRFDIGDTTNAFAQAPLRSPTVFNFFEPDYVQPGALAAAGLFAPEHQILTDTTALSSVNQYYAHIFNNVSGVTLSLAAVQSMARTPDPLIDALDRWLAAGNLTTAARERIRTALTSSVLTNDTERLRTAIYLVITSPDAAIQR